MQSYPIYLSPVILVSIPVVNGYLKKKEKTNEKNEKRIWKSEKENKTEQKVSKNVNKKRVNNHWLEF